MILVASEAVFSGKFDRNLTDQSSIVGLLNFYQSQFIINTAAHTAIDKAEIEPRFAFAIISIASRVMAYSTDYLESDVTDFAN